MNFSCTHLPPHHSKHIAKDECLHLLCFILFFSSFASNRLCTRFAILAAFIFFYRFFFLFVFVFIVLIQHKHAAHVCTFEWKVFGHESGWNELSDQKTMMMWLEYYIGVTRVMANVNAFGHNWQHMKNIFRCRIGKNCDPTILIGWMYLQYADNSDRFCCCCCCAGSVCSVVLVIHIFILCM